MAYISAALNVEALLAAKKLVEQVGGMEHSTTGLSVLEKLG
jgi:hypothetical protein